MKLHALTPITKPTRRLGRGNGSGAGTTAGRGSNGQKSRSGHRATPAAFEGGQMPFHMRLPKLRGFSNPAAHKWATVSLDKLVKFPSNAVNVETLQQAGLITRQARYVKLIGSATLPAKLKVAVDRVSAGAHKSLKASGITVTLVETHKSPKPSEATPAASKATEPVPDAG